MKWHSVRVRWLRCKKFINKATLNITIQVRDTIRNLRSKVPWALGRTVDIVLTGVLAQYALTHFNFLSTGIMIALATYYIEWFVTLVKRRDVN